MIYSNFTDTELRRAIDNNPGCIAAQLEAARRFLNGSDEVKQLEEANERLSSEISRAEDSESEAWAQISALEAERDESNALIRKLEKCIDVLTKDGA